MPRKKAVEAKESNDYYYVGKIFAFDPVQNCTILLYMKMYESGVDAIHDISYVLLSPIVESQLEMRSDLVIGTNIYKVVPVLDSVNC